MADLNSLFTKAPLNVEKKKSQKKKEEEQWDFLKPLFREAIVFRNERVHVYENSPIDRRSNKSFSCKNKLRKSKKSP